MKKYLVKRVAIVNGIKETSYIGKDYCQYDSISDFIIQQYLTHKNLANAIKNNLMFGSLNCKVLSIKVIEV